MSPKCLLVQAPATSQGNIPSQMSRNKTWNCKKRALCFDNVHRLPAYPIPANSLYCCLGSLPGSLPGSLTMCVLCHVFIVKALRPVPPIRITPIMFIKPVQNQSKMKPGAVPERSPRHFPRKAAKSFQKSTKKLQKSNKRYPNQNYAKNVFKMIKNGLGAFFVSTSKK